MQYADFGRRSGLRVSRVSLGAMRFGTDRDKAIRTIRTAIDNGVNYIDTSPSYYGGMSEELLGEALQDGYRDKVYLSSKWSYRRDGNWRDYTSREVRKVIDRSLRRMKTDYLDFFQLWLVRSYENYLDMCKRNRHMDAIRRAIREGVVRRTGITGHPPVGDFPRMFEDEIFEICTISYNYLNASMLPDIRILRKMGVGVVIMNPCGGGILAQESQVLKELLPEETDKGKTVELAYRYVLGTPGVSTIIAGMDTSAHARHDFRIADMKPLTALQRRAVDRGVKRLEGEMKETCTGCGYCDGCPKGIMIPYVFAQLNHHEILGLKAYAKANYKEYIEKSGWRQGGSPTECIECGKCEEQCPNKIPIIQQLKDAHRILKPRGR